MIVKIDKKNGEVIYKKNLNVSIAPISPRYCRQIDENTVILQCANRKERVLGILELY